MNSTEQAAFEVCALCRNSAELRMSHIVSKFVWKYLRTSAGAGGFRIGTQPNKPVQDGIKTELLCEECEIRLSKWENKVSSKIFLPLMNKGICRFKHDENFSYFCVSIAWRVLVFFEKLGQLSHMSGECQSHAKTASEQWRAHLLSGSSIEANFEHHVLPMPGGAAAPSDLATAPPNLNRYLSRSIDMDVVGVSPTSGLVYVKLCRLLVIGFINILPPHAYKGTKLAYGHGKFKHRKYEIPAQLGSYIENKAEKMLALQRTISPAQRKKMEEKSRKHGEAIANSAAFEAWMFDVNTFGTAAFDD